MSQIGEFEKEVLVEPLELPIQKELPHETPNESPQVVEEPVHVKSA